MTRTLHTAPIAAARAGYVLQNLAKNALAPVVARARPARRVLGMDGDLSAVSASLERLAEPLRRLDARFEHASVVELGPGRTPDICAAAVLAGADRALGVDVNVYLDAQVARTGSRYSGLVDLLDSHGSVFLGAVGADATDVRARARDLGAEWPLEFTSFDGVHLPLPDASVDAVLSKSVLEHVPLAGVNPLLRELRRVLRPGGLMAHVIDLRDHLHVDGDERVVGDWLEALRYPQWLFDAMFSRRATAINRIRASEWEERLRAAGFDLEYSDRQRFPLPPGFDAARLQPRWRTLDDDELSVGLLTVGARVRA